MQRSHLVDSGALAALLDPREEHHAWARRTFGVMAAPWLTCEAVITETFFLLEEPHARGLEKLLRLGTIRLAFSLETELGTVLDLRAKYHNVPMSVADACLVRMSEVLPDPIVVTTDSDFTIYRRHGRKVIATWMP